MFYFKQKTEICLIYKSLILFVVLISQYKQLNLKAKWQTLVLKKY